MTDTRDEIASITDRVRPIAAGAGVVGVHVLKGMPVFVLGEEALLFAPQGEERRVAVHAGAILDAVADGKQIVTAGDDGRVVATGVDGKTSEIATDAKKRWIDHVALGPDGAVAWSAGKTAFVRTGKGELRSFDAPSTVAGLAFGPKGFRLAIAHYNGVTLWFPNAKDAKPEVLEWKGSHLSVTWSPDGRFLVTSMQEAALHGWRVADSKHMRMSGYSARVRSMDWSADGDFLATSGSEQIILWPFQSKDGPMGKQPRILAPSQARASAVACHPKQPVVAAGYSDGMVLLVRIDDAAEILARRPAGAPVTALSWAADGALLAFGTEDGEAGVITL
ncbi:MAG TPA: WD40 repeat domain-containing protein [Pseudolabrys sp.]|nr:WD40 repeat domain-containing protein [Pseudolabrys sp.]